MRELTIFAAMSIEYILSPLLGWLVAQLLKAVIYAVRNGKFEAERLFGDGGMPSCHSSMVTALAVTCLMCFGIASIEFAIALVLALVVTHDAFSVRLESGKQAKAINEIHENLQALLQMPRKERLEELLGHTPLQVFFGALTGALVAVVLHFCLM